MKSILDGMAVFVCMLATIVAVCGVFVGLLTWAHGTRRQRIFAGLIVLCVVLAAAFRVAGLL